jgi:hypothetical protein
VWGWGADRWHLVAYGLAHTSAEVQASALRTVLKAFGIDAAKRVLDVALRQETDRVEEDHESVSEHCAGDKGRRAVVSRSETRKSELWAAMK